MADRQRIIIEIADERVRQLALAYGRDTAEFDKMNTQNDWVSYIAAYSGRASAKVGKNRRQDESFRANMIKVAALALAAVEAFDDQHC